MEIEKARLIEIVADHVDNLNRLKNTIEERVTTVAGPKPEPTAPAGSQERRKQNNLIDLYDSIQFLHEEIDRLQQSLSMASNNGVMGGKRKSRKSKKSSRHS